MTTQKPTSSKRKLDSYAAARELDKAAKALAAREGIPMVEAYPKAFAALQQKDWERSRPTGPVAQEQL